MGTNIEGRFGHAWSPRQRKNKDKEDKKNKRASKFTGKKRIPKIDESFTSKLKKKKEIISDEEIENESSEEESFDEDDVIILDRNLKVNDYVLVKFDTNKSVYHYVGQIEEVGHSLATIKFMRMSKIRNTFMYPDIEDISSVPLTDIKTKLPEPTIWTKRGNSKYTFNKPIWVIPNMR